MINLATATRRWNNCTRRLVAAGIPFERVEAVDGKALAFPHPDYDERGYRLRQGRRTIPAEVGCYFSHVRALQAFLDSGDDFGLILEDDASVEPDLYPLISKAIAMGRYWDLLRLSRINKGKAFRLLQLDDRHHLGVMFTREKGAGAYVVNRRAATIMVAAFRPMNLPYDIMFDREWLFGYRTMVIYPFPVSQKGQPTQIQYEIRDHYIPPWRRYWTVFPFRAAWETGRVICRGWQVLRVLAGRT